MGSYVCLSVGLSGSAWKNFEQINVCGKDVIVYAIDPTIPGAYVSALVVLFKVEICYTCDFSYLILMRRFEF